MIDLKRGVVTLATLRRDFPQWKWSAERDGLSWEYYGKCGDQHARVYAVAAYAMGADDDYVLTSWRASTEGWSGDYWLWRASK